MSSPLGTLCLRAVDERIVSLGWVEIQEEGDSDVLATASTQLTEYFSGSRKYFELPLAPLGSDFQQQVCHAMTRIPFGDTITYGELAASIDSAAQPVGNACGGNSIPIIIPCHRVVGSDGLGGYSGEGGIDTKLWLLRHEKAVPYLI